MSCFDILKSLGAFDCGTSLQPFCAKEHSVGVEKEILCPPFAKRNWDTTLAGRACKLPARSFFPDGQENC